MGCCQTWLALENKTWTRLYLFITWKYNNNNGIFIQQYIYNSILIHNNYDTQDFNIIIPLKKIIFKKNQIDLNNNITICYKELLVLYVNGYVFIDIFVMFVPLNLFVNVCKLYLYCTICLYIDKFIVTYPLSIK